MGSAADLSASAAYLAMMSKAAEAVNSSHTSLAPPASSSAVEKATLARAADLPPAPPPENDLPVASDHVSITYLASRDWLYSAMWPIALSALALALMADASGHAGSFCIFFARPFWIS